MHDNIKSPSIRRLQFPSSRRAAAGTLTAAIVLGIALLVSVVGLIITYRNAGATVVFHSDIERARGVASSILNSQLDESAALGGYVATGDQSVLGPYYDAEPRLLAALDDLRAIIMEEKMPEAVMLLADIERAHRAWQRILAQPVLSAGGIADARKRLRPANELIARIRVDAGQLGMILEGRSHAANDEIQLLLRRAATFTAILILLFGVAAIVADMFRGRTQAALERERTVADTLQLVFLSAWDTLGYARIGTAYVSATREAAIGGDLFDVHRIDEHRSMLLVADVSGKGLASAVDTALVKYSIRMLAQDESDPGGMLEKFNRLFIKSTPDPSAFVSIFLGVLDVQTSTIRYSSAGHGSAYVRRNSDVWQLPATGPLIGLQPTDTFASTSLQLSADDMLVVATDGLPEARDSSGMMLDDERAMRWIAEGSRDPQVLADEIVGKLGRFCGGRISDDLALLIIRLAPASATTPPAPRGSAGGKTADGLASRTSPTGAGEA